jgi:DNA polymerase-3 subunit alpha
MIALYRPGPMKNLDEYVNRKSGKVAVRYDHPLLETVLKETYGVMIYQEQVQKAANVLAGYSLGQADILRAAMSKKDEVLMAGQKEKFIEGCAKVHRIPRGKAADLFEILEKFAGYGFNKAHSTAYALLAYRTAYLKANYPAEFMSALLTSEMGNLDKLPVFMGESEEMGFRILKPDINTSGVRFVPAEGGIRFGLAGIKNVGEAAAEALVAERERNGPFRSLTDFCSRLDGQTANRKVVETLVRCGAMDSLGAHRARLLAGIDFAMSRAAEALRDRRSGQGSLFQTMGGSPGPTEEESLPDCAPWKESELLAAEKEFLGVYMSGHPLTQYAPLLRRYQLATVESLAKAEDRSATRLGGIVAQLRKTATKDKKPMAIVSLEDVAGSVEVVVYPEAYEKYGACLGPDAAIMVCGQVRNEDKIRIVAQEIYRLEDAPRQFAKRLSVHLPAARADGKLLEEIRDLFRRYPGPTPVTVCLQFPGGEKVFLDTAEAYKVLVHEDLVRDLQKHLGEKSVYVSVDAKPCPAAGPRARGPNETRR